MLDRSLAFEADLPLSTDEVPRALLDRLAQSGYDRIEPPVLQPATHFLDLGGEEIRASLYSASDPGGAELCLRPEYTIPVCRAYLAAAAAGRPAAFSYCGPVFRFQADGTGEFVQAGLESFGRDDKPAADAEILGVALEAAEAAGSGPLAVRFGDAALLDAVLDGLRLPANWQRRLKRGLAKGEALGAMLAAAPDGAADHSGVLAALAGADAAAARALVDDLLAIAGIASVGGRSADEIADRFLSQVALRAAPLFSADHRAVLQRFLSITGEPDAAARDLRRLAGDAGLNLAERIDEFEERTSFMAALGVQLSNVTFHASYGSNFNYYTGFIFEAHHCHGGGVPVIEGGRYDRLAQALSYPDPVPAVGAAIWPERLRSARGRG